MSRPPFRFALLGALLAAVWWLGRASGGEGDAAKPQPPTSVAIVDLARIFKDSPRIARLRERLRDEYSTESADAKSLAESVKELKAKFDAAEKGSREQRERAAEFQKKYAELQASAKQLNGDFAAREAELYRVFYEDAQAEVARYAKERGIGLVVRFQEGPEAPGGDVKDAKAISQVLTHLNQLVVYHDRLDVTDAVIARMKAADTY